MPIASLEEILTSRGIVMQDDLPVFDFTVRTDYSASVLVLLGMAEQYREFVEEEGIPLPSTFGHYLISASSSTNVLRRGQNGVGSGGQLQQLREVVKAIQPSSLFVVTVPSLARFLRIVPYRSVLLKVAS